MKFPFVPKSDVNGTPSYPTQEPPLCPIEGSARGCSAAPQCGHASLFTLLLARLTPQSWRQVSAGRWRAVGRPMRRYEAKAVLAVVCEACGCPVTVPPALLNRYGGLPPI